MEFYEGKQILLTGCTGFIGKVLLEKVMRSMPNFGKLYIMVRGKRNQSPKVRLREILSSYCFARLKKSMGEDNFWKMANEKVVPIEGDLI